jgi:hypothetical protein
VSDPTTLCSLRAGSGVGPSDLINQYFSICRQLSSKEAAELLQEGRHDVWREFTATKLVKTGTTVCVILSLASIHCFKSVKLTARYANQFAMSLFERE